MVDVTGGGVQVVVLVTVVGGGVKHGIELQLIELVTVYVWPLQGVEPQLGEGHDVEMLTVSVS